ncbi:CLUMA_CG018531, isoform A [Clunio marinus]|uniref:CLUMA_CG018531, isoform A n=1 Tax=Clunio marinus TaxID=568069 RepID=A0A1J1J069_9DIPT|nr:CLUMA_CG018531, isoform A [Clunio marinus]
MYLTCNYANWATSFIYRTTLKHSIEMEIEWRRPMTHFGGKIISVCGDDSRETCHKELTKDNEAGILLLETSNSCGLPTIPLAPMLAVKKFKQLSKHLNCDEKKSNTLNLFVDIPECASEEITN